MSTVTCIVSKLLQVMYCKYCNVYCKLSDCKKIYIYEKKNTVGEITCRSLLLFMLSLVDSVLVINVVTVSSFGVKSIRLYQITHCYY